MGRRQLVIVALPSETHHVQKVSSEKEPHLTLLYLGENNFDDSQITLVTEYVEHASSMLSPFMLDVESRGELGDKKADVLFFAKKWSEQITTFRCHLLKNDLIAEAYLSVDQFPDWTPHLTMGYPDAPAKKDVRDYPVLSFVTFDRIALWTDDYEGPTFRLKDKDYDDVESAFMSQTELGRSAIGEALAHYGVKGMKWGVRRSQSEQDSSSGRSASEDSTRVDSLRGKAERGGAQALSNSELKSINERMNLEQQYAGLVQREPSAIDRGNRLIKKTLSYGGTAADVYNFVNSPFGKSVRKLLIGV